jgi:tRNA-specific 2-thiouridylase
MKTTRLMVRKRVKVAVGLSGGVDSSVAAYILKEKGYDVVGVTMEIYDGSIALRDTDRHSCYGPGEKEEVEEAASICKRLGIPFHTVDLRREYRRHVIDYVRSEYLAGRTPNPCVVCNNRIKFGFLLEKAGESGIDFEFFATGHYARIEKIEDRFFLKKALDRSKDQTYFLYALSPEKLSRTLFPIGTYKKQQIKEIASALGFGPADRLESQDFIGGGDYSILFKKEEAKEGDIIDETGNILGRHRGIFHYTVGQRRGLGIASDRPLYVTQIDAKNNVIKVSNRENLFSKGLIAADINLIAVHRLDRPYQVQAKIRQQHTASDATVFSYENNKARVEFNEPQMSITPGQSVVLYTGDTVFGGGIIEQPL